MSDLRALYTIYFNSNNCERFNNDTSHVLFRSNNDIIIGDDEDIEILCPQCVLPISFYNVNSNNNSFVYTLSGSTVTVTLTAGNYSASSFVTLFNSLLSGIFVLTYSPATLVFTILTLLQPSLSPLTPPVSTCSVSQDRVSLLP